MQDELLDVLHPNTDDGLQEFHTFITSKMHVYEMKMICQRPPRCFQQRGVSRRYCRSCRKQPYCHMHSTVGLNGCDCTIGTWTEAVLALERERRPGIDRDPGSCPGKFSVRSVVERRVARDTGNERHRPSHQALGHMEGNGDTPGNLRDRVVCPETTILRRRMYCGTCTTCTMWSTACWLPTRSFSAPAVPRKDTAFVAVPLF